MYLFGKHCPKEVLMQPDLLLRSRSVRMIRPLLNYWLRDFVVTRPPGTVAASGERIKVGQQPPLGSLLFVHTAPDAPEAPPILAQVCSAETGRANLVNSIGLGPRSIAGMEVAACGCNTLWCGAPCSVALAGGHHNNTSSLTSEGVWVQYFDLTPSSSQGRIRTEMVPYTRLSLGSFANVDGEKIYSQALKALGESRHHL